MGRDPSAVRSASPPATAFQSTLPAWGETVVVAHNDHQAGFQSTLPAWGETENGLCGRHDPRHFNPLSPHGERPKLFHGDLFCFTFQSTLPAWGETAVVPGTQNTTITISIHSPRMGRDPAACEDQHQQGISIHSPRMGRDVRHRVGVERKRDFNPLSPHGERRGGRIWEILRVIQFQSTLPAWGETRRRRQKPRPSRFQSTLPAWGETRKIIC